MKWLLLISGFSLAGSGAHAQNIELVGQLTGVSAKAVYIDSNYAYLAGFNSFEIVDISNPAQPALVGRYDSLTNGINVVRYENYAYIADGYGFLKVLDITDPAHPILSRRITTSDYTSSLALSGHYLYVDIVSYGFQTYDITAPDDPQLITEYPVWSTGIIWSLTVRNNYVYMTDSEEGFKQVNVSDPLYPELTGLCETGGSPFDISIWSDLAFISDTRGSIYILDVREPYYPAVVGTYARNGSGGGIFAVDHNVYLAAGHDGVLVIRVNDPDNPVLIGSYHTPGVAYDVSIVGDLIYVADGSGFRILRLISTAVYDDDGTPGGFVLYPNYPNPFNAKTAICYELPSRSEVTLSVFNVLGERVDKIEAGPQDAGQHEIVWDAGDSPSGIYFYQVRADETCLIRRMVLLK